MYIVHVFLLVIACVCIMLFYMYSDHVNTNIDLVDTKIGVQSTVNPIS